MAGKTGAWKPMDGTRKIKDGDERIILDLKKENLTLKEELRAKQKEMATQAKQLEARLVEQRRLAEELAIERGQLQAVIENMEEAVGIWDADCNLVAINNAAVRLYGFETKEQMLKHLG